MEELINKYKKGGVELPLFKEVGMIKYLAVLFFFITCCETPTETECKSPPEDTRKNTVLTVLWATETDIIVAPTFNPYIIDNEKIIYAGEIQLVSLNTKDGTEEWRGEVNGEEALRSKTLQHNENLILSAHRGSILGWSKKDGEQVIKLTREDGILVFDRGRNLSIDNGFAFVGDTLDAYIINSDGSTRLTIDVDLQTRGLAYEDQKLFLAQFEDIHGLLSIGKIRAFDTQTGDSIWTYSTNKSGFLTAGPTIEDGILYAGALGNSPEHVFVALDPKTGAVIWEYINEEIYTYSFAMGAKNIFVNNGSAIIALDKKTGVQVWKYEWISASILVEPVYLEGYVYHSDHGKIFILDAETGELKHEEFVPKGNGYFWKLAVSKDKLFAQTSSQLIAYEPWHLREE